MKMETKKWYVGQIVYDKTISDEAGKITRINHEEMYVEFESLKWAYSLNGVASRSITELPTLSTTPYEIKMEGFSQEVEDEELPKKGDVCWGRHDVDDEWDIGHFMEKDEFGHYILSSCNNRKNSFPNTEITTKNPYEIKEDREPQIGDMVYAWDDDNLTYVIYGELIDIDLGENFSYSINNDEYFKHCSLKNPLIK